LLVSVFTINKFESGKLPKLPTEWVNAKTIKKTTPKNDDEKPEEEKNQIQKQPSMPVRLFKTLFSPVSQNSDFFADAIPMRSPTKKELRRARTVGATGTSSTNLRDGNDDFVVNTDDIVPVFEGGSGSVKLAAWSGGRNPNRVAQTSSKGTLSDATTGDSIETEDEDLLTDRDAHDGLGVDGEDRNKFSNNNRHPQSSTSGEDSDASFTPNSTSSSSRTRRSVNFSGNNNSTATYTASNKNNFNKTKNTPPRQFSNALFAREYMQVQPQDADFATTTSKNSANDYYKEVKDRNRKWYEDASVFDKKNSEVSNDVLFPNRSVSPSEFRPGSTARRRRTNSVTDSIGPLEDSYGMKWRFGKEHRNSIKESDEKRKQQLTSRRVNQC